MFTKDQIEAVLEERHTKAVQDKLKRAHVGIAGLGGLGSNVAVSLARIGVGHLHLVDFDKVDLTNLNRQQYFVRHVGINKTEALMEILKDINPYIEIKIDTVKVNEDNIYELFKDDEIICEAFDVAENKVMLIDGVLDNFPEKYLVTASGMGGYGESNLIETKKLGKKMYLCGDLKSDIENTNGLMAPRVMICAGHEANAITKIIIDDM